MMKNKIHVSQPVSETTLEQELTFKNILLSAQMEESIDGILIVNSEGKMVLFNRRFVDMWHLPLEVTESKSDERAMQAVRDLLVEPDSFFNKVKYLYGNPIAKSCDEIKLIDGRILDRYSAPILVSDDKCYGRVWFFRDITERKNTDDTREKLFHDLGERVKELNCMYGITRLISTPDISLDNKLQSILDLIPAAWQYPELTCARLTVEGKIFITDNFAETTWKLTSQVSVNGKPCGILDICYLKEQPASDEGPFLKEERNLINAVAERIGKLIDRSQL